MILATLQGLIAGAFIAHEWLEATSANFPGHEDAPGRFAFAGEEVLQEARALRIETRELYRLTPIPGS